MRSRSIRGRKSRRRIQNGFELQLTALMDSLVILVVFLLKSYQTNYFDFSTVQGMKLPTSTSPDQPMQALQVILTPEGLTFEDKKILEFVQTADGVGGEPTYTFKKEDLDEGGRRIVALFQELTQAKDKSEILRLKSKARDEEGKPLPFDGTLAIQADKRIHYDTLRRVMYTAAASGYRNFKFLAMKRDQ